MTIGQYIFFAHFLLLIYRYVIKEIRVIAIDFLFIIKPINFILDMYVVIAKRFYIRFFISN